MEDLGATTRFQMGMSAKRVAGCDSLDPTAAERNARMDGCS